VSQENAEKFLDLLDKDDDLRDEVRKLPQLSELGKKHNLHFTGTDLEKALESKWGTPANRKGKVHPFTCCCG
jgi:hypothetical protein